MRSVLLGNGINIQFGGLAYSSDYIMKRIKYNARLDKYDKLFGNTVSGTEIEKLLNDFVLIANDIRMKKYDEYIQNDDTLDAVTDFQIRYNKEICAAHEIMLEDWFLVVYVFFLKNSDLEDVRQSSVQAFEFLILDAIFNNGKIQELYTKMNKKVKKFFCSFDNIFTLNYDNNIEKLTNKRVYHLHGDYSVLANSENTENVLGFIREKKGQLVWIPEMKHCFCNALLNYSGQLKYEEAETCHELITLSESYTEKYRCDALFRRDLERLKIDNPLTFEMIMAKINHPELNMATEYYFEELKNIQDELTIIGMSPNNDAHIFNIIINNPDLKKVVFYYFSDKEKKYIENNYSLNLFECKKVGELWEFLNCQTPEYNCNYNIPDKSKNIIEALNLLSDDKVDFDIIKKKVNQIPQFEIKRLCKAVREDMKLRNFGNASIDEKRFIQQNASICSIALQEGILPSVLYLVCVMNFKYIEE